MTESVEEVTDSRASVVSFVFFKDNDCCRNQSPMTFFVSILLNINYRLTILCVSVLTRVPCFSVTVNNNNNNSTVEVGNNDEIFYS
jgi:hypothetical protein